MNTAMLISAAGIALPLVVSLQWLRLRHVDGLRIASWLHAFAAVVMAVANALILGG